MIPGAFHAPRGMLEFWVDPDSPYYKPVFAEGKTFILYCQADWRGVLAAATLADMGMPNVLHLEGGYGEWKKAGGPTAARDKTRGKRRRLEQDAARRAVDERRRAFFLRDGDRRAPAAEAPRHLRNPVLPHWRGIFDRACIRAADRHRDTQDAPLRPAPVAQRRAPGRTGLLGLCDRRTAAGDRVRDRVHLADLDRGAGGAVPGRAHEPRQGGDAGARPGGRAGDPAPGPGRVPAGGAGDAGRLAVLRHPVHRHQAALGDRIADGGAVLDVGDPDAGLPGGRRCRAGSRPRWRTCRGSSPSASAASPPITA